MSCMNMLLCLFSCKYELSIIADEHVALTGCICLPLETNAFVYEYIAANFINASVCVYIYIHMHMYIYIYFDRYI